MSWMDRHKEGSKWNCYGYRLIKGLFFIKNDQTNEETVNFEKILRLFTKKLEQIVIMDWWSNSGGFKNSIHLNALFAEHIMLGIKTINKTPTLQSVFQQFLIINPYDSITIFIKENQSLFEENGWILRKIKYEDKKRGNTSDNVLSIKPL